MDEWNSLEWTLGLPPPDYNTSRGWFHRKNRTLQTHRAGRMVQTGAAPDGHHDRVCSDHEVLAPVPEQQHHVESCHDISIIASRDGTVELRNAAAEALVAMQSIVPPRRTVSLEDIPPQRQSTANSLLNADSDSTRRVLCMDPALDPDKRMAGEAALQAISPLHSMILDLGYDCEVTFLGEGTFGRVLGLEKNGVVVDAIKIGKRAVNHRNIVNGDFGREAAAMMISSASPVPFALPQDVSIFGESCIAAVPSSEPAGSNLEEEPLYIGVAVMKPGICSGRRHLKFVNASFNDPTGAVTAQGWSRCRDFFASLLEATASAHLGGVALGDMKPSNWMLGDSESGRERVLRSETGSQCVVYLIDFGNSRFDSVEYVQRRPAQSRQPTLEQNRQVRRRLCTDRAVKILGGVPPNTQPTTASKTIRVSSAGDAHGPGKPHANNTQDPRVFQRAVRAAFGVWGRCMGDSHHRKPKQTFLPGGGTTYFDAPESGLTDEMSIVAFQAADIFAIGIAFLETLSSTGHVQFEWEEFHGRQKQKASLARQKVALARASHAELWTKHLRKEGSAYGQRLTPEWTQALHLARGLICEDPKQRLTAKQALKHPFFTAVQ